MGTDRKIAQQSEIVIIGAGVIGLLIAWYLAKRGKRVLVVDQRIPGRESSWAGGGIISPLYPDLYPVLRPLVQQSASEYPTLVEDLFQKTGVDCELLTSGLLVLDRQSGDKGVPWDIACGKILSLQELRNLEPLLQPPSMGAIFYDGVQQVRNPRFIEALRQALIREGVEFFQRTAVAFENGGSGQLQAILTNEGIIEADTCVVAAGAWTGDLINETGLRLPIRPIRGQMIVLHPPSHCITRILVQQYRYLIPRRDGRILVGSTLEDAGYDKQGTVEAAQSLHSFAGALVPVLKEAPIEHHWTGLRPGSPDGAPFIGEHPGIKGLLICAGHYRNGFATGPASALLAVEMMLGGKGHVDSSPFRLDRACPPWRLS